MQTTYRLKEKELTPEFLKAVKSEFTDKELEITIKSVEKDITEAEKQRRQDLIEKIRSVSKNAPRVDSAIDIRALIQESRDPNIPGF